MYGIIYKITNTINGKSYVGQTTRSVELRFKEHSKCKESHIGRAIRKYGAENFTVAILEECDTPEQLNEREKFWIAHFDCKAPKGYNLEGGGHNGLPSEETRAKLSAMRKGIPKSPEHRAKIAASNRGKKVSDETRARIGQASRGRKHSKETLAKMSAAHKGEKNYFFGKHFSPELAAKLSASHRGETPYKNLVAEIDKRKISYNELAHLLNMNPATISNKMRGKNNFTTQDRDKIVELFGLPAEYLFLRDDGSIKFSVTKRHETSYKNLVAEMDKRKISYANLAKLLNLKPSTISNKMCGEINFTAKDIAKLVEIFGLPAEYLMARADD